MATFFSNVPIWVFPLFFLLLALGLRASKDRTVPLILIGLLPLLGILTLRNIIALSPPTWVWFIAAISYGAGVALGMPLQRGWIVSRSNRFVDVKGEWATLTAMMILFIAGFVNGFLSAVMPTLTSSVPFLTLFTMAVCLPAGQFLGRTIATLRTPVTQAV